MIDVCNAQKSNNSKNKNRQTSNVHKTPLCEQCPASVGLGIAQGIRIVKVIIGLGNGGGEIGAPGLGVGGEREL